MSEYEREEEKWKDFPSYFERIPFALSPFFGQKNPFTLVWLLFFYFSGTSCAGVEQSDTLIQSLLS